MPQGKRHSETWHGMACFTFKTLLCTGAQTSPSTWIAWPCCVLPESLRSKEVTKSRTEKVCLGGLEGLPMSYLRPERVSLVCAPSTQRSLTSHPNKRVTIRKTAYAWYLYAKSLYIHQFFHVISTMFPNMLSTKCWTEAWRTLCGCFH